MAGEISKVNATLDGQELQRVYVTTTLTAGLLSKYDEEIAGKESKKSFEIGSGGQFDEEEALRQERERIRQRLNKRMVETLEMPAPRCQS
jgi:hypothetical protein